MSLLKRHSAEFVMQTAVVVSDGQGSYTTTYTDGFRFTACIRKDNSAERMVGNERGTKNTYSVITTKSASLSFGDIIKRVSDGMILRVVSDGTDCETPTGSWVNMRIVDAEVYAV